MRLTGGQKLSCEKNGDFDQKDPKFRISQNFRDVYCFTKLGNNRITMRAVKHNGIDLTLCLIFEGKNPNHPHYNQFYIQLINCH